MTKSPAEKWSGPTPPKHEYLSTMYTRRRPVRVSRNTVRNIALSNPPSEDQLRKLRNLADPAKNSNAFEREVARRAAEEMDLALHPPTRAPIPREHPIYAEARAGRMTKRMFESFAHADRYGGYERRNNYAKAVSWSAYTSEFIDSLAKIVRGKKVLEVCAGNGVLGPIMRSRGIEWISTDEDPLSNHYIVKKSVSDTGTVRMDAITAIRTYRPDIVFASWIPYESDLDTKIMEERIPMILVGEGYGGCTGCQEFWGHGKYNYDTEEYDNGKEIDYTIERAVDKFPGFQDVTQWDGIHDQTYIVTPKTRAIANPKKVARAALNSHALNNNSNRSYWKVEYLIPAPRHSQDAGTRTWIVHAFDEEAATSDILELLNKDRNTRRFRGEPAYALPPEVVREALEVTKITPVTVSKICTIISDTTAYDY